MSRRLSLGNLHVGPYCGARIWRPRDWRTYGLFRRTRSGFSIGPVYFWRESIPRERRKLTLRELQVSTLVASTLAAVASLANVALTLLP